MTEGKGSGKEKKSRVRTSKKVSSEAKLPFAKKLVLNRFLLKLFGAEKFEALAGALREPNLERVDAEGMSGFFRKLSWLAPDFPKSDLEKYDLNIRGHLSAVNEHRDEALRLKYFQWLALIFTEIYLDRYFNGRERLLDELNGFLREFNTGNGLAIPEYREEELNKLAFWSATGSGKTILMHVNYRQYLHYAGKHAHNGHFILLTPNEGLSKQHLLNARQSGIPAEIFDKNRSAFSAEASERRMEIIEVTKLKEESKDKVVAISDFGNANVLFVDEGHRGSSGDAWMDYRRRLCENGFSFEYSATFGQAVEGAPMLENEYSKCILFDYSYKYFYQDGYGKDYRILNLRDDREKRRYLTASLLTFYQQKRIWLKKNEDARRFRLENPLFVFVGTLVTGSNGKISDNEDAKILRSDVVEILEFLRDFLKNENGASANEIETLLTTGMIGEGDRDVFFSSFSEIKTERGSSDFPKEAVFSDLVKMVFNSAEAGAELHLENLKGAQGEIALRLGDNPPFGVINVGDDAKLLALCGERGFHTGDSTFGESLFSRISDSGSPVNILIGSKKFSEGWDCYRVSTMGLMNVGKREGSQIIQLFGRGVRLHGYGNGLKRSMKLDEAPDVPAPKEIAELETLSVFGVRADYMEQFRKMLEKEGVPSDSQEVRVIVLPVVKNKEAKKVKVLRVREGLSYKKDAAAPSMKRADVGGVVLDCYAKIQFTASKTERGAIAQKHEGRLGKEQLAGVDCDAIYFELLAYKNERGWHNLNLSRAGVRELLAEADWYRLLIPEEDLKVHAFEDYGRFQRIAVALLKKYCERLYFAEKTKWERNRLETTEIEEDDPNFKDYEVFIGRDAGEVVTVIENLSRELVSAREKEEMPEFEGIDVHVGRICFRELACGPMLHLDADIDVRVSPTALVKSEWNFLKNLKDWIRKIPEVLNGKEVFVIRNRSRKGIGFFEKSGFYPDFIIWVVSEDGAQKLIFVDPHGMRQEGFESEKVMLFKRIKEIETELSDKSVTLEAFIVTETRHADLTVQDAHSREEWNARHVLFMEDEDYVAALFG